MKTLSMLMTIPPAALCLLCLMMCSGPAAPDPDPDPLPVEETEVVVLSEYVEGSSNNKAVEIRNTGTVSLDLSRCRVDIYANGGVDPSYSVELNPVVLESGDVYVVAHSSFQEPARADQLTSWVNFNGDDALVLFLDDAVVDGIGRVGEDPGDAWTGENGSTRDMTLRRKESVLEGDVVIDDHFDPDNQWDAFPRDDFTDLGS